MFYIQLRDNCVPCSPSAHGAQSLVDRPPLDTFDGSADSWPDYDYSTVDGPTGRDSPGASFWASRTAYTLVNEGSKTIEQLKAGGGWRASIDIHFGGSSRVRSILV